MKLRERFRRAWRAFRYEDDWHDVRYVQDENGTRCWLNDVLIFDMPAGEYGDGRATMMPSSLRLPNEQGEDA